MDKSSSMVQRVLTDEDLNRQVELADGTLTRLESSSKAARALRRLDCQARSFRPGSAESAHLLDLEVLAHQGQPSRQQTFRFLLNFGYQITEVWQFLTIRIKSC